MPCFTSARLQCFFQDLVAVKKFKVALGMCLSSRTSVCLSTRVAQLGKTFAIRTASDRKSDRSSEIDKPEQAFLTEAVRNACPSDHG
jgi:hypothetical protein